MKQETALAPVQLVIHSAEHCPIGTCLRTDTDQTSHNTLLCRKTRQFAQSTYTFEVSRSGTRLLLSAYKMETTEVIVVEIPLAEGTGQLLSLVARVIFGVFKGDYELLIDCTNIVNNKLIITAPKIVF